MPIAKTTCSSRGFKALMLTQFLGALNDNLIKLVLSLLVVNQMMTQEQGRDVSHLVILNAIFVLPYILLSPFAGSLADRFPKSAIVVRTKMFEIGIMVFGCVFLYQHNLSGLFFVLFLLGVQAALFSPAKYGILPEILTEEELSRGNGAIECWTFVAIITGTAFGGMLVSISGTHIIIPGLVALGFSFVGVVASLAVTRTEAANPAAPLVLNPLQVVSTLKQICAARDLRLVVLGICYFWFVASMFQLDILIYAKELAHLNDLQASILITSLAFGVGLGSWFAGVVSAGRVELGLVPLGGIGLTISSVLLVFSYESFFITLAILFFLGCCAGFFIVPLNAYLQEHSPETSRGSYIAASNVVTFIGVLLTSAVLLFLVNILGFSANGVILFIAATALGITAYLCMLLPQFFVRCVNWILVHTVYRLTAFGMENVPKTGGALLVCNHITYADASLLLAAMSRPVRFLMYEPIYRNKLVHPFAKACKAIPVAAEGGPKAIVRSLAVAREAIQAGEVVAIFSEGSLTRIGRMLPFSRGLEQIMKHCSAPIIPVYLDQMWGSVFSFSGRKFFWKRPRRLPYPVTVVFGKPLPPDSTTVTVREAIQELSTETFANRRTANMLLSSEFIRAAKRGLLTTATWGHDTKPKTYLHLLTAARCLRDVLAAKSGSSKMVGIALPPSYGAVIANVSLLFGDKVPVNLNYTASVEAFQSAVSQCEIRTILSTRSFWAKLNYQTTAEVVFLEDLQAQLAYHEKILAAFQAVCLPAFAVEKLFVRGARDSEQLATVIFSSGSVGEPKGVMLSHRNVMANLTALNDVFNIRPNDCMLGVLPFFHSFGFTGTLWLPLLSRFKAVYYHNPLDGKVVGSLAEKHRVTLLLATPTFLQSYIRRCTPAQFQTLRIVVVGAEKLHEKIARAFVETFDVVPMEGYGCTELSPVAAINLPDYIEDGIKQKGYKLGTVGHPLPGVAVKVVDPETGERLGPNSEGLLQVKGANVMMGYLNNPAKTAEVINNGWYVTGDIAKIDEDGFVTITDRLSRFSKIGGEMVPHGKVEEEIQDTIGFSDRTVVVTGISDPRKGERLVVLSTVSFEATVVVEKLQEKGLPNLWIPKPNDFFKIESFPLLGSGKLDLRAIKDIAQQLTNS